MTTVRFFIRQFIHDVYSGISKNRIKYLLSSLVFFTLCLLFYAQTNNLIAAGYEGLDEGNTGRSVLDYLIFMSRGIEVYVPSPNSPFVLPIFWTVLQVFVALLVSVYPTDDLHGYATNVLTRTGSRHLWWASKVGWIIFTVCSFYLLGLVVILGFSFAVGDTSLLPIGDISLYATQIDALGLPLGKMLTALLVSLFVSIALSLVQMTLSFILKPALSFLIVMAYGIASAYFNAPFLIGAYSMMIRNGMVLEGGLSNTAMLLASCAVALIAAGLGAFCFKRMDIL
jgi:hypothetical protein